jgi:hypothetical protein
VATAAPVAAAVVPARVAAVLLQVRLWRPDHYLDEGWG